MVLQLGLFLAMHLHDHDHAGGSVAACFGAACRRGRGVAGRAGRDRAGCRAMLVEIDYKGAVLSGIDEAVAQAVSEGSVTNEKR